MKNQTQSIPLDDPQAFDLAVKTIWDGGVIAFPTDTVYGIGADAYQASAVEKIYQVKDRSLQKAIPILIGQISDLPRVTSQYDRITDRIITKFWPGALTLIVQMSPDLPEILSPDGTLGVRIPDHAGARELLKRTGPLATTSANLSGQPSAMNAGQVMDSLANRIDLVLDGGPAPGELPSTVLDLTSGRPQVLREGPVSWQEIQSLLEDAGFD